jgi:hypothetical protein
MAKTTPTKTTAPTPAAPAPAAESTALDVTSANAWLVEDDGKPTGDLSGTEGIGLDEIRLPRLAIAQGLSPQLVPGDSKYIEDLKQGDMFNDLTGEIFGRGPIHFVPVRRDVRYIEFRPRSEGGGVLDLNVPANDPRTQWTSEDGIRVAPAATHFVEFVVLLLRAGEQPAPIVLSIKTTNKWNRGAATSLSSFIKLRNDAIYGGVYTVQSKPEKNDKGTFGVYVIHNAGKASPIVREVGKTFHDSLKGKTLVVDRDPGADDDFDTAAMDSQQGDAPPM